VADDDVNAHVGAHGSFKVLTIEVIGGGAASGGDGGAKRYSGYDTFTDRSERLSEMVQKNNTLLESLGANGLISPGCDECDSNYGDEYYLDDDEPDYLDLIRSVARGAAT
jgi:hypothetical protein